MSEPLTPRITETVVDAAARLAAKPIILFGAAEGNDGGKTITYLAVPKDYRLDSVDVEATLPAPRLPRLTAKFSDAESFVEYVNLHANGHEESAVWVQLDPDARHLSFCAVLDEYPSGGTAWRRMRADFQPTLTPEWKAWMTADDKPMAQLAFAEFLQDHQTDVLAVADDGMPSSHEMLQMALNFAATSDDKIKSIVRPQSGGIQLVYINMEDEETERQMRAFERFRIAIPVFRSAMADPADKVAAYPVDVRLRYRRVDRGVTFTASLQRPDLVYTTAATALIGRVRADLGAQVRVYFGLAT
jgi:uncharacterized protein YfdQ (DUF2303 family)